MLGSLLTRRRVARLHGIVLVFAFLSSFWQVESVRAPLAPLLPPLVPAAKAEESPPGTPRRIIIPKLRLNVRVQDIGLLPGGKLDVPRERMTTGWYKLGPRPGQNGNAVIDGHLRTAEGPGAFWLLKNLRTGDLIHVMDEHNEVHTFRVRETALYDVRRAPMRRIFGRTEGAHLNLITCAGRWDTALGHYDKRLIVYTDAVPDEEGPMIASARLLTP